MTDFLDEATIEVTGGDGGDGAISFRREKFIPYGGPDGGHGGRGGDVILLADKNLNMLSAFRSKRNYVGGNGLRGSGRNMHGRDGADLRVRVPVGTVVRDAAGRELLTDLLADGEEYLAVHGGRGGRGNSAFAKPTNQAPRIAEHGEPGQTRLLRLELKLIADVGLVGMPNAGKSTLLSVISNARPKIADYPFTTLSPNLGVVVLNDEAAFVAADIPGLIEGAHEGHGLGDRFLKHIERTRLLVHLLDGNSADPLKDYAVINAELAAFNPVLGRKPQLVVLNKMDLPGARKLWPRVRRTLEQRGVEVMAISGATSEGVRELVQHIAQTLAALPPEPPSEVPVVRPELPEELFVIEREDITPEPGVRRPRAHAPAASSSARRGTASSRPRGGVEGGEPSAWRVRGRKVERMMAMTYWDEPESIDRFQRILRALGVDVALRQAGVKEGDLVRIGAGELEWTE